MTSVCSRGRRRPTSSAPLPSVLARERSINFCNRRTRLRSPALDAVKIRCRNRRTSASAHRQSTWRQCPASSSGPLTTTSVSSLSYGSGIKVIFLSTGSPDRVSTLSGPGTRPGIRPVIQNHQLEGWLIWPWFPVAFPPPAFASRSSTPAKGSALLTVGSPAQRTGPRRGYRVPHARAATGVGAPCAPRTTVLIPD
jgi:hypothetical protein